MLRWLRKKKGPSRFERIKKKITWLCILFIIGFWLYLSWDLVIGELMKLSWFATLYPPLEFLIVEKTAVGMFLASVIGGLFFIFLPLEGLFAYFATAELPLAITVAVLFAGNAIGLSIDFWLGRGLGEKLARRWLKAKYDWYKKWVEKLAGFLIVVGNALFFPIQLVSLIIGTTAYPYKRFFLYTLLGSAIKFALLIIFMLPRL